MIPRFAQVNGYAQDQYRLKKLALPGHPVVYPAPTLVPAIIRRWPAGADAGPTEWNRREDAQLEIKWILRQNRLTAGNSWPRPGWARWPVPRSWPRRRRWLRRHPQPLVLAPANGNKSRDAAGLTCVARAFQMITAGADVLDAVIAGVNIVELDPEDTSVGYGGLPNAEGVVQLDASVMHGPLKRAGAVACLEGVRTPSLVAMKVMEETDNHLLVGKDAQRFARNLGFKIEADLNHGKVAPALAGMETPDGPGALPGPQRARGGGRRAALAMAAEGLLDPDHFYGTINCNGVNAKGEVAGVTTTSGLAWKIPGRVGDSPILGAGLYVDGEVGAAGSTGRGEANLFSLGSFLVVEGMRHGKSAQGRRHGGPETGGGQHRRETAAQCARQAQL